MENRVDEEIRQYKLFKIQEAEVKLKKYKKKYEAIKEHVVIKFSKNLTSNILKIVIILLSVFFFSFSVLCFFPNAFISIIEINAKSFTSLEKSEFIEVANIFKYVFIVISLFLYLISYLLKVNNRKRNSIYSLAILLEEVMDFVENTRDDDKRKYEQFVELIAERNRPSNFQRNK